MDQPRDLRNAAPTKIGMAFQSRSLIGWFDVVGNLALPL